MRQLPFLRRRGCGSTGGWSRAQGKMGSSELAALTSAGRVLGGRVGDSKAWTVPESTRVLERLTCGLALSADLRMHQSCSLRAHLYTQRLVIKIKGSSNTVKAQLEAGSHAWWALARVVEIPNASPP